MATENAGRGRGEEGEARWSGQKIGHKINSIQSAGWSLLLGSNISRRFPLRGRVGSRSPGEGTNNGTLYRAPGARSQHPYIIIHTGKKAEGTFAAPPKVGGARGYRRHQVFRIKHLASVSRNYVTSYIRELHFNDFSIL